MQSILTTKPYLKGTVNVPNCDSYKCTVLLPNGKVCPRVELSYKKMLIHLAVEHSIRKIEIEVKP